MDLITIIVPVYNVEQYLSRCIDSLIKQTYKNIEIILVDDGSTDLSGKICNEYANRNKSIKVIHKKNGGLSSARNVGLKNATGKYVGFVDSDDWVTPDMFEYLYHLLKKTNTQVATCSYALVKSGNTYLKKKKIIEDMKQGKEILSYYMVNGLNCIVSQYPIWNKLYDIDLFKNISFPENQIYEDAIPVFKIFSEINSLAISNKVCYFYFQNSKSITRNKLKKRDFDLLKISDEWLELSKELQRDDLIKLCYIKKARSYFSLLMKGSIYGYSDEFNNVDEIQTKLLKNLRKNYKLLVLSNIQISKKVLISLVCINPKIVNPLYKLYKWFQS